MQIDVLENETNGLTSVENPAATVNVNAWTRTRSKICCNFFVIHPPSVHDMPDAIACLRQSGR